LDEQAGNWSTNGVDAAEAQITLREVRTAFGRLPIEQQQALLLVSVEGYSYRESAELLDVPIGTVISRVARGRVALLERTSVTNNRVALLRRNRG